MLYLIIKLIKQKSLRTVYSILNQQILTVQSLKYGMKKMVVVKELLVKVQNGMILNEFCVEMQISF